MKRILAILFLLLPLSAWSQQALHVDTSGNPTTTLNLSGSKITGGLTLGGHPVIDAGGNIFYRTGVVLANFAGNLYYSNSYPMADSAGDLYYSNGNPIADTYGNLYYPNGDPLADAGGDLYYGNGHILASSGKLYTSTGQIVTGGPATFPFTGPVYSPSSGGTPVAETGAQAAALLSGQTVPGIGMTSTTNGLNLATNSGGGSQASITARDTELVMQDGGTGFRFTVGGVLTYVLQNSLRGGASQVYGWSSTASPGDSLADTAISRTGAATVAVGNGTQGDASGTVLAANFTASAGVTLTGGAFVPAKSGTFTLSSGAATVSNTGVTSGSVIHLTVKKVSGTRAGIPDVVPTVGTGFTAAAASSDNSTYNYWIED